MRDVRKKTSNVKKIILAGLAVLAGVIVLAALGVWIFFIMTFSSFRSEKDYVEVAYPRAWTVKEHPETDVIAVFVSPKENALDAFYETVNLSTYDMAQNPHTTEKYVEILAAQLEMVFGDVKLSGKIPFLVAGRAGYRLIFDVIGDLPRVIVVYAFTIRETGYNLLYMGDVNRLGKDLPLMDLMALTLKVNL